MDIKDYEKKIHVRNLVLDDYDQVIVLQKKCYPRLSQWTREQFESQLSRFSEGQFGVFDDRRLVGICQSVILNFDLYSKLHTYKQVSDDGYIRNHDPDGETLYGIEIMVDPEYRGLKIARRLYDARKRLAKEKNLMRIVVGGRIPGYAAHADAMSAREYVDKVIHKTLIDPVLTAQISNGFTLKRLLPDYLKDDEESKGWATFLEWTNLDYVQKSKRVLTPIEPVRICAVQYQMRAISGFNEFARHTEYFVDVASDYHCDFILFPEMFTTQLLSFLPSARPAVAIRKLSEFTHAYLEHFTKMAVKHNVNIIGGSHFTVEGDDLFNIAYLFRRDGTIGKQYKLHITPSEKKWWGVKQGSTMEVFETDSGKIAILICYDMEFPELARMAVEQGAEILFTPFCTDERSAYLRVRYCAQARAIENQVYTVIAGGVGNLPSVENLDIHYAQSAIFTPSDIPFSRDAIMAEASPNVEMVILGEVDLELLKKSRQSGSVLNWKDRRLDIYGRNAMVK